MKDTYDEPTEGGGTPFLTPFMVLIDFVWWALLKISPRGTE